MNKQVTDAIRLVLKVGGAALATSGLLPATCDPTSIDPAIAQYAGILSVIVGAVWGQISASHHQQLKEVVDNGVSTKS